MEKQDGVDEFLGTDVWRFAFPVARTSNDNDNKREIISSLLACRACIPACLDIPSQRQIDRQPEKLRLDDINAAN